MKCLKAVFISGLLLLLTGCIISDKTILMSYNETDDNFEYVIILNNISSYFGAIFFIKDISEDNLKENQNNYTKDVDYILKLNKKSKNIIPLYFSRYGILINGNMGNEISLSEDKDISASKVNLTKLAYKNVSKGFFINDEKLLAYHHIVTISGEFFDNIFMGNNFLGEKMVGSDFWVNEIKNAIQQSKIDNEIKSWDDLTEKVLKDKDGYRANKFKNFIHLFSNESIEKLKNNPIKRQRDKTKITISIPIASYDAEQFLNKINLHEKDTHPINIVYNGEYLLFSFDIIEHAQLPFSSSGNWFATEEQKIKGAKKFLNDVIKLGLPVRKDITMDKIISDFYAQKTSPKKEESIPVQTPENRVALVIGNANYKNKPLNNPINDADDMAETLKKAGFQVLPVIKDANKKIMKEAIRNFGKELKPDGVGVFYYSGHGVQYQGKNYLLPVDALDQISAAGHLEDEAVVASYVLSAMEESKAAVNIVILDACRDSPFKGWSRNTTGQGLAAMQAPSGSLIAYSTKDGQVASDGEGRNSPYVKHLKTLLLKPNISVLDMLTEVRSAVMTETGNNQKPAIYSELNGSFCFVGQCQKK
jgi:hypothetical protein